MKRSFIVPAVVLCATLAFRFTTLEREVGTLDDTLDRYKTGRASLQRAIDAVGGYAVLSGFNDMSFSFQAVIRARGQSSAHDAPYTDIPAAGRVVFRSNGKVFFDFKSAFRGGREVELRRVFDANEGWTHRLPENELTEMTAFDRGFLLRNPGMYPVDAMPHSLLLTALGNASSIRGDVKSSGKETLSIEFSSSAGVSRTLVLNAKTGLPVRVEYVTSDPLQGDTQAEVEFSEYRTVDGIRIPYRLDFTLRGENVGHWVLDEVAINTSPSDDVFARPDFPPTERPAPFQPQQIADGVYAVRLYSGLGFTYNTMLIEMDDYVVVVEAPLSDFFYNVVAGIAEKVAPGKPIRYVVSTHYHFDHTNGIKAYMANGVTVLTVGDNADYLRKMAAAEHTLLPNPLRGKDEAISIEVVEKEKTMRSGDRTLRLINVGPNPHVDEILIAYLPNERVMFVSDLISTFDGGHTDGPTEALLAFNRKLDELGIESESIVPGHGPVIQKASFKAALGGL